MYVNATFCCRRGLWFSFLAPLLPLLLAVLPLQAENAAAPIEVGVAWEGKAAMPERVLAGVQEALHQQAPEIRLDIRKELGSLQALEAAIGDFEAGKRAMIILRSSGAELLGRRGAAIPAFIGGANNPVALGAAERLDKPKPNITGVTYHLPARQRFESFKFLYPPMRRALLLVEDGHPGSAIDVSETQAAAAALEVQLRVVYGRTQDDLVAAAGSAGPDEVIVLGIQALVMDSAEAVTRTAGDRVVFGLSEQAVERGALAGIVADDQKLGRQLGLMLVEHLIQGKPVSAMPIQTDPAPRILFHYGALEQHKEHLPGAVYHLAKSRQLLESIQKSVPTGIGVVENRNIVQVNDYILNLTGYSREELLGKNARILYPTQEEFEYVGKEKYRQIAEKGTGSVEVRWRRKDGGIRHVILSSTPLDRSDLAKGVTFTVLDITERKVAEEKLRESEERFSTLFHGSAVVMLLIDPETGQLLDANAAALAFYGWSREAMLAKTIREINVLDSEVLAREMLNARNQKRTFFEFRHRRAGGDIREVAVHSSGIRMGAKTVLFSIIRDVSEQKLNERRVDQLRMVLAAGTSVFILALLFLLLRLSASLKRERASAHVLATEQRRLRSIAGNVPGVVYQFYATPAGDYGMGYLSERAAAVFGFDEVPGLDTFFAVFVDHVHPEDREGFLASIREAVAARTPWHFEFRFVKPSGTVVWFSGTSNLSPAPDRIVFDGLILDITERKQAEEALQASRANLLAILENTTDIIAAYDREIRLVAFNQACRQAYWALFGIELQPGLRTLDLFPAQQRGFWAANNTRALAGEAFQVEFDEQTADGKRLFFESSFNPIRHGSDVVGFSTMTRDITARKRAEEAVKETTTRLFLAARAGGVGIWDYDVVNNRLQWDDQMYTLYGISRDSFSGVYEAWRAGVHPEDTARGDQEVEMALQGEKEFDTEFRVVRPDGTVCHLRALATVFRDSAGKPLRMIGTNWDITRQKQAEAARCEALARFSGFANASQYGMGMADLDGHIVFANPTLARMLGETSAETCLGKHFPTAYYSPAVAQKLQEEVLPALMSLGYWHGELEIQTIDGRRVPTEENYFAVRDEEGRIRYLADILTDITERQQAEKTLRESEAKYRSLLQNSPVGFHIYTLAADGRLVFSLFNPAADAILHTSHEPFIGCGILEAFPGLSGTGIPEMYAAVAKGERETQNFEAPYCHGGIRGVYEVRVFHGAPGQAVVNFVDISERKQAEEAIDAARKQLEAKNKELEQLVYVASHDLRSPLVNVDGFSRELELCLKDMGALLQEGGEPTALDGALRGKFPELGRCISRIRASTRQMDNLLKAMLTLSRAGRAALRIEPLDMNQLLAQLVPSFAFRTKERGIQLTVEKLPPCRGDATQVTQVFSNLIDNAIKYLDKGRPGIIVITGSTRGGRSLYRVADNGIGIEEGHREIIFDLFYRLNPRETEGEGLGLTMVRQALLRQDGEISVESTSGTGSAFVVNLPGIKPQ